MFFFYNQHQSMRGEGGKDCRQPSAKGNCMWMQANNARSTSACKNYHLLEPTQGLTSMAASTYSEQSIVCYKHCRPTAPRTDSSINTCNDTADWESMLLRSPDKQVYIQNDCAIRRIVTCASNAAQRRPTVPRTDSSVNTCKHC